MKINVEYCGVYFYDFMKSSDRCHYDAIDEKRIILK